MRKILNALSKTAAELFYFELGKYPLRIVWSKRRFMYLWEILHRDTDELVRKVYETQKLSHNKGDWYLIMQNERAKYEISESDDEISKMSQNKFRKIVEKKIHQYALKHLNTMASKHSKSTKIAAEKFEKKAYFSDHRFSKEESQLLFALRTKMIDCKSNFRNQFDNVLTCRTCQEVNSVEDEDHLLSCKTLNTEEYDVQFSDVYCNLDKQYKVTKVFKRILRRRQIYLDTLMT